MTSAYRLQDDWSPVWWEPVLWPGATWDLTLTLHGAVPGAISGAALWMDGREFPVTVTDQLVLVRLTPEQADSITDGAAAQLYLDVAGVGRYLWLHGRVTRGGRK